MKSLHALLGNVLRASGGNVAVTFGLALLPLVLVVGSAVDYSRAASWHTRLQSATDATVLSLCQADATVATADLRTQAQAMVQGYIDTGTVTIADLQVTNNPRTVQLRTAMSYPTAFLQIAGQPTVALGVLASCSANETYFEIALVLDVTGSMNNADPAGTTKMASAKTAAANFTNYMYSKGAMPGHLKMSLVPFSTAVAVNPATYRTASWLDTGVKSSLHWQYVTGAAAEGFANRLAIFTKLKTVNAAWDWGGCLESLPYPLNVQDGAPSPANGDSYFLPYFAPDEVGNNTLFSTSTNSYLADGTSSTGSCQNDASTQVRMTQACKYKTPTTVLSTKPGPNWYCPTRPLTRLGATQATLLSEITALTALGSTNIHEGLMWGWRTISPTSVFSSDATAYGTPNTKKFIVLMTDGENQWLDDGNYLGSNYSAYGYFENANGTSANTRLPPGNANLSTANQARAAIDALTLEGCANAKAKNVTIYTIGFSTPGDPIDTQGLSLLKNCSSGSGYNFVASDANSLIDAFDKIGQGIGQLRLTN